MCVCLCMLFMFHEMCTLCMIYVLCVFCTLWICRVAFYTWVACVVLSSMFCDMVVLYVVFVSIWYFLYLQCVIYFLSKCVLFVRVFGLRLCIWMCVCEFIWLCIFVRASMCVSVHVYTRVLHALCVMCVYCVYYKCYICYMRVWAYFYVSYACAYCLCCVYYVRCELSVFCRLCVLTVVFMCMYM